MKYDWQKPIAACSMSVGASRGRRAAVAPPPRASTAAALGGEPAAQRMRCFGKCSPCLLFTDTAPPIVKIQRKTTTYI